MMPGDREPPGKVGRPRSSLSADTTTTATPALTKNQAAASDRSGDWWRERHNRPARVFRDAFRRGALDALRTLRRQCCPDCTVKAEQLADYYRGTADRWAS